MFFSGKYDTSVVLVGYVVVEFMFKGFNRWGVLSIV